MKAYMNEYEEKFARTSAILRAIKDDLFNGSENDEIPVFDLLMSIPPEIADDYLIGFEEK